MMTPDPDGSAGSERTDYVDIDADHGEHGEDCARSEHLRELAAAMFGAAEGLPLNADGTVRGLVLLEDDGHLVTAPFNYSDLPMEEAASHVIAQMIAHLRGVMRAAGMRLSVFGDDGSSPWTADAPDPGRHDIKFLLSRGDDPGPAAKKVLDAVTAAMHGEDGCDDSKLILIMNHDEEPATTILYHGYKAAEPGTIIADMMQSAQLIAARDGAALIFVDGGKLLGGSPN